MYDALAGCYRFSCPVHGEERVSVPLSSFRTVERFPGARRPAVFSVDFDCVCGDQHLGLVSHDQLDWAPIAAELPYFDLMTARVANAANEMLEQAAVRIRRGEWPWSFFCYPEGRTRPVPPSALRVVAPGDGSSFGVAFSCPACGATSVNLVTQRHLDLPFVNDPVIEVVEHVFSGDIDMTVERFADDLWSGRFDSYRLTLDD